MKQSISRKLRHLTLAQTLPVILFVGGLIAATCAAILTIEKIALLKDPKAALVCDINPIVACGSVINTHQASAFGFPNPIMGLIGFGMLAAIGAGLLAGAQYKRWFWRGLQIGVTFGIGFVFWLQYQSIFQINALCPFCMVVWTVMIPLFWYTTLYNIRTGVLGLRLQKSRFAAWIQKHHGDILVAWYVILIAVILQHFWYFWKTLLP